MASTSSSDSVFGPNTGIVPGPTRMASATSSRLEDVTGGANVSGPPVSGAPLRCAADSVPPMPVDEWQAAQFSRYNSAPWASDGGFTGGAGTGGPGWPRGARVGAMAPRAHAG